MPINQEAFTKLVKARIAMIMQQPFFGQLALNLRLVERTDLNPPTLATDGKHFYYHPDWVLENPHDVVMSGVAHEVGHCIFEHIGRRNGRSPRRWNQAGDFVINDVLKDCGFTVPNTWLHSPVYKGMSTDTVYTMLPEDDGNGGGGPGGGGAGEAFDSISDAPADGSIDPAELEAEWKIATSQAATNAEKAGKLPASMKRFVDEMLAGKADWRAVLRRFATEVAKEDFSWQRFNRKMVGQGIYLPALYSEAMGEMIHIIDTSGSISDSVLKAFGAEISSIRDQMQPSLTRVIYCDAEVNHVDEFERYDVFKVEGHGGGGTDFRPPFKWIEERGAEPKCVCYLTDGYGPFPDTAPAYPVLWLMTTDVVPPWGEVVRIEV